MDTCESESHKKAAKSSRTSPKELTTITFVVNGVVTTVQNCLTRPSTVYFWNYDNHGLGTAQLTVLSYDCQYSEQFPSQIGTALGAAVLCLPFR